MNIYTTTIAISILIYIAIGNYAGRGIKRLDDYYVAGRRAPTLFILGTLIASVMSSTIFLGEAGFAYAGQAGPYILFPQISSVGYVLGAIFFGRYLRRSRAKTVADFFGQRFNSRRVQAMAGITIILGLGGYLLAVTQGAAILLSQLTDLGYVQGLTIAWLSYTTFTMYSGSRAIDCQWGDHAFPAHHLLCASVSIGDRHVVIGWVAQLVRRRGHTRDELERGVYLAGSIRDQSHSKHVYAARRSIKQ